MRNLSRGILICFLVCSPTLWAQDSSSKKEIQQLKSLVEAQQKALEKQEKALEQQQTQIQELRLSVAEEKLMLTGGEQHATLVPAVGHVTVPGSGYHPAPNVPAQAGQTAPVVEEQPTPEQEEKVEEELQRGPEIADVTPDTPAVALGPARLRLIGYPALTSLWRSTNSGGNVGTSFASLPFSSTVPGNTSEFRLSPQSTRLAIRVDADLSTSKVAGYFEMDFGGSPNSGTIAVTSSSYTFRIRQAWFDYTAGKWEFTGGQFFSLMTPLKKDILPWPGDVATTQVVDTNYVAGLVNGRYPQVRVVYRPSKTTSLGFSLENPEQQVGNNVTYPAALSSILTTQYNTGSNELKVPNLMPDMVFKGSYTNKFGDRSFHMDAGFLLRVFRSYNGTCNSCKDYDVGYGGNVNIYADIVKKVRLVLNGFASEGGGRYIGGLAPDAIVLANGTISPINSYSWIGGFEIAPSKATGFYAYYSGVYAQRNSTLDSNGTLIGYGFPGANLNADRVIEEFTGGYSRVIWKHENLGSVQWGGQYAYVWLAPWVSAGSGTSKASANMVFGQVRYNLP
jgi:hypothetical protein